MLPDTHRRSDAHGRSPGHGEDPAPGYVVLDRLDGTRGGAGPADVAGCARQLYGTRYTVVSDEQNIAVVRIRPSGEPSVR